MTWPDRALVFDVEAGGIDVFNDRIVQLFIGIADGNGDLVEQHEWIINPGVDISEESIAVHGFTNEFLRENGDTPHKAFWEADLVFKKAVRENVPVVAFNLNYDLSILTAEMARNKLESGYGFWIADNVQLIDGLVIDRAKDKYRKGKRKLEFMAAHYGVPFDPEAAHNAAYDVEVTAKVTRAIVNKYGMMSNADQAKAYRAWADNFQQFLRRSDPGATVNGDWPLRLEGD